MRMKWIGKLTGGLLGAVALGPIGAALGVLLGHQFDEHGEELQAGALPRGAGPWLSEAFFLAALRVMWRLANGARPGSEPGNPAARAVLGGGRPDGPHGREA